MSATATVSDPNRKHLEAARTLILALNDAAVRFVRVDCLGSAVAQVE